MQNISHYIWRIISIALLFNCFSAEAKNDKQGKPEMVFYGFSVGLDVLHPILHIFNHDRMGVNADLQFDLWHKLYPTFVVGYDWFDGSDEYDYPIPATNNLYKVNGLYFKIGASYNVWRKNYKKPLNPIAYFGISYACSPGYKYEIANYPISNNYWNKDSEKKFNSKGHTTSQWGEIAIGVKAPIAKGFCLGFEAMFKLFLHINEQHDGKDVIHQTYSPEFGDKESGKWGFRYTLNYFFPTSKKRLGSTDNNNEY